MGGPGKDRLSCGSGRDTAIAGKGDVLNSCEVVRDPSGNVVPVGQQGGMGGGVVTPPPVVPSDWTTVLTRGYGAWVERVDTSLWLYFFRPEIETAGFRRGSRNFCPNSNCALAPNPPRPFIWTVQSNVATVQFVGGITTLQLQLLQYDSATDTLEPPERVGLRRPSSGGAGTRISLGF